MSNYANAKAYIDTQVYSNHLNQVSAPMVSNAIKKVIDSIIAGGYLYAGVAHPGDAAINPDANVFYIATEAGTYTNKGGLVVADGEVAILKYNGSWSKEVTGAATAAEVSALGQEVDVLEQKVEGLITHTFSANSSEHSAAIDQLAIELSAGDTIQYTLSQGTGVCDGSTIRIRFYKNGANVQTVSAVLGVQASVTLTSDIDAIGVYMYRVTTYGTFVLSLVVPGIESKTKKNSDDIQTLKSNKGAFATIIPFTVAPNISTTERTLTIHRGSIILYNKTYYPISEIEDVVVNLSGIASGNKKVIFDWSNNSLSCVAYNTALTETQAVVMAFRTDYVVSGLFTIVYFVSCGFAVSVDGTPIYASGQVEKLFPAGNIDGFGSINVSGKFKETTTAMPGISQTIFDTTTYSVGVQSMGIYNDIYAVYVINATDRNDSTIQKIGILIADITTKTKLGEFQITSPNATSHGNNCNFGEKYDANDTLPLVYVSLTYSPYECLVLRIANDFSTYTQIQQIIYTGTSHFATKKTIDWVIDGSYIWAYGSYWDNSGAQFIEFVKFAKPTTGAATISLSDADVLDSFTTNNLRIAQGAIIHNGKIYVGLGYEPGAEYIKVVDIASHGIVAEVPLSYEPEGIDLLGGKICVCGGSFALRTYEDAY